MTEDDRASERHSESYEPDILIDPAEIAAVEARNVLRQFDFAMEILSSWLQSGASFHLRFSHLLNLNRIALEGIHRSAGTFRTGQIRISHSPHVPPDVTAVPDLVADFCDYVNSNFASRSALHLAAYVMWRINWIHPFADGNGRTARILSYMILSAKLGYRLPGTPTIPERIAENKRPYYAALEEADRGFLLGRVDVSATEKLIASCLAAQLLDVHHAATTEREATAAQHVAAAPMPSNVEYKYIDLTYRPSYQISVPQTLRTASEEVQKNWIERNPALVTAVATVASAFVGALATYLLTR